MYRRALEIDPDLIISTAGVSVGAADLVRIVMDELGDIDFWRINMRPGKPLAFGKMQGVPFFGLPGNPVSTMVTFEVLVRPALAKIAGRDFKHSIVKATLEGDLRSDGRRSYDRVTLSRGDGGISGHIDWHPKFRRANVHGLGRWPSDHSGRRQAPAIRQRSQCIALAPARIEALAEAIP